MNPLLARARVAAARTLLRLLRGSPTLRRRLARGRAAPVDGEIVDEELACMLALDDVVHDSDYRARAPVAARAKLRESMPLVEAEPPAGIAAHDESIPGRAGRLPVRLYTPPGVPAPTPGLVFFHGGGWVTGDLETHDRLCRRLAGLGRLRVVAVAYRLGPEHRFPAGVDDAVAAFRHVAAHAVHYGIDPARLGVGGDSAGGNLAAVVARRTRGEPHVPALAALIYPGLDATRGSPSHRRFGERYLLTGPMIGWYLDHYLGPDPALRRHVDVSPLLAADPGGVCPHLVVTAHFDPLRDEGEGYARRLAAAGVPVKLVRQPTMIHGFAVLGGASRAALAATEAVIADVAAGLRGELRYDPAPAPSP